MATTRNEAMGLDRRSSRHSLVDNDCHFFFHGNSHSDPPHSSNRRRLDLPLLLRGASLPTIVRKIDIRPKRFDS